jgi:hypothetical protein
MDDTVRTLPQVSYTELHAAVEEMCARLGIPGSLSEVYDLYLAVLREREKAASYIHRLNVGDD